MKRLVSLLVAAAMLLANLPSTAMYYEHVLSTDLSLLIESPDHVVDPVSYTHLTLPTIA